MNKDITNKKIFHDLYNFFHISIIYLLDNFMSHSSKIIDQDQHIKLIYEETFSHSRSCVQCLYVFCFQNNMERVINIHGTSFSVVDSSNNYQGAGTKTKLFENVMLLRLFPHNSVKTLCFQNKNIHVPNFSTSTK